MRGAGSTRPRGIEPCGLVIDSLRRRRAAGPSDGPQAGYFPFYIGLAAGGGLGLDLVQSPARWRPRTALFATASAAARVLRCCCRPPCVYVAVIFCSGIYVASALFIGYFMRATASTAGCHGRLWRSACRWCFFLMFEAGSWCRCPRARSIEAWLGF
jgi:hypothetical protein